MKEDTVFLIHPETQDVFTIKETAMLLGITTGGVYARLRLGDVGKRLWRPKGAPMKENEPGDSADLVLAKCTENERHVL